MDYAEARQEAALEASSFDGMIPGWHKSYARPNDNWHIILLRQDPDRIEHIAREICSRLLSDDMRDCMRVFAYRRGAVICQELNDGMGTEKA